MRHPLLRTSRNAPGGRRVALAGRRALVALAVLLALGLLLACEDPKGTPPVDGTCGHIDFAGGLTLVSHGTQLFHQFGFTESGQIEVANGSLVHMIEAKFLDANGAAIPIANDCEIMEMRLEVEDARVAEVTRDAGLRWSFNVEARQVGTTGIYVELWHEVHRHFRSERIPVNVTMPAPAP